ncbi:sugar transporter SWEET1-like [Corticium candelabrum]|uniref:sugar transporter SWEET1-like n=1 Tax=Corticium candelabrum TaxID=121492 RepID=UPI002E26C5AB|nr:sugar transporter SWEET1-like [Corticium candelabrum]
MDRTLVLSCIAAVSTVAMYGTGFQTCKEMRRKRNVKHVFFVTFLSCNLSCILWLKYGVLQEDITLIVVNIVGVAMHSFYMLVYFLNTTEKSRVMCWLCCCAAVIYPLLIYIKYFVDDYEKAVVGLGVVCSLTSLLTCSSRLFNVIDGVKRNDSSTQLSSGHLTLTHLLVAVIWTLYGRAVGDSYIQITNLLCALLGCCQFWLFLRYPRTSWKMYDLSSSHYANAAARV